jgi:hypothetical protein
MIEKRGREEAGINSQDGSAAADSKKRVSFYFLILNRS